MNTNTAFVITHNDEAFIENELAARNALRELRALDKKKSKKNDDADVSYARNVVNLQHARTQMNTSVLRFTVYDDAVYDFTYETRSGSRAFIVYHYLTKATNTLTFIALDKATLHTSRITECNADAFDAQTFFDDDFCAKFVGAVKYVLLKDCGVAPYRV